MPSCRSINTRAVVLGSTLIICGSGQAMEVASIVRTLPAGRYITSAPGQSRPRASEGVVARGAMFPASRFGGDAYAGAVGRLRPSEDSCDVIDPQRCY